MSGRKQHFIPQSLLRGFGSEGKGKKVTVVAYTYDRGTFTVPTDGIGAERDFYSELSVEGRQSTLDDQITAYENRLAAMLQNMRRLSNCENVESSDAAELISHLIIRNDHVRRSMSSATSEFIHGVSSALKQEHVARKLLGLEGGDPSDIFSNEISKMFLEYENLFMGVGLDRKQLNAVVWNYVKNNFSDLFETLIAPASEKLKDFAAGSADIIAKVHRRALVEKGLLPKVWFEKLSKFNWIVIQTDFNLILPDCIAISLDKDGVCNPLIFNGVDEIGSVIMPLSSRRLLVGNPKYVQLNLEEINENMASCSWDFFVSCELNDNFMALKSLLRNRPSQVLGDAVYEVFWEIGYRNSSC